MNFGAAFGSNALQTLTRSGRHPPPGAADAYGALSGDVAGPAAAVLVVLLWFGAGVLAVAALVRAGADLRGWVPLALAFGPVTWAWASFRSRPRARAVEVASGTPGPGRLKILVAVLARPEGVADADRLLRMISRHEREIVLVRPIGWLAAADPSWNPTKDEGARMLATAALFAWERPPRQVLVPGHGAAAIARFAGEQQFDLVIVVGSPAVTAAVCRSPQLRDQLVVRASQIAAFEYGENSP